MATGDVQNFIDRLKIVLPPWFGESIPLLNAFLTGFATMDAFIYSIMTYIELQMRLQTATDDNLDIIACDYFGNLLFRAPTMTDAAFMNYIQATLLEEMATRKGMIHAITVLTEIPPIIWEPWDAGGNAAYNIPVWGYNTGGSYGSNIPYNFWINVFVIGNIMNNYGVFDFPTWGYNQSGPIINGAYGNSSLYNYTLTYDEILALINRIKVGGTVPHLTVTYL